MNNKEKSYKFLYWIAWIIGTASLITSCFLGITQDHISFYPPWVILILLAGSLGAIAIMIYLFCDYDYELSWQKFFLPLMIGILGIVIIIVMY